jgi:hypothetical protein
MLVLNSTTPLTSTSSVANIKRHSARSRVNLLPHLVVRMPSISRAVSRHVINVGASKGFVRKQVAPAVKACSRTLSSGKAVMKMNGTRAPRVSKSLCSSIPFIAGIWTSAITQAVLSLWPDRKNSSADANVCTAYPCDLRRLFTPMRTDTSSSMIEITGTLDKVYDPSREQSPSQCSRPDSASRIRA